MLPCRSICERRLCETVDVETVAHTLTIAEQNNGNDLKRVCLDFVSRNLACVMKTEGYSYMTQRCPGLQAEILATIAQSAGAAAAGERHMHRHPQHAQGRPREHDPAEDARRTRQRRE